LRSGCNHPENHIRLALRARLTNKRGFEEAGDITDLMVSMGLVDVKAASLDRLGLV
jgi:hypothetical protein